MSEVGEAPVATEQEATTEVNLFFDTPEGFGGHLKFHAASGNDALKQLSPLSDWLAKHGYKPSAARGSAPNGKPVPAPSTTPAGPVCETCQTPMVLKAGVKNNKAWQAWMCPNGGRNIEGHKSVFV